MTKEDAVNETAKREKEVITEKKKEVVEATIKEKEAIKEKWI
jgi:hypothetical protein